MLKNEQWRQRNSTFRQRSHSSGSPSRWRSQVPFHRFAELIRGSKPASYFEDFDGIGSPLAVMRPTRRLANLFEFPVLFYVATAILISINVTDDLLQKLCWAYVSLRWLHAISHLLLNRLWLRTPVFAASNIVLLMIWVWIALLVLECTACRRRTRMNKVVVLRKFAFWIADFSFRYGLITQIRSLRLPHLTPIPALRPKRAFHNRPLRELDPAPSALVLK